MEITEVSKELANSPYIGIKAADGTYTFIKVKDMLGKGETLVTITEREEE